MAVVAQADGPRGTRGCDPVCCRLAGPIHIHFATEARDADGKFACVNVVVQQKFFISNHEGVEAGFVIWGPFGEGGGPTRWTVRLVCLEEDGCFERQVGLSRKSSLWTIEVFCNSKRGTAIPIGVIPGARIAFHQVFFCFRSFRSNHHFHRRFK